MDLLEYYFKIIILCASASYFAIFVILSFFKVPQTIGYLPYRKARRSLAFNYLVIVLNLVTWLMVSSSKDWDILNPYIKCADFIFFYLEAIFFCYSFSYLVNDQYLGRHNIAKDGSIFVLSSCLMFFSVCVPLGFVGTCLSVVAFLAFFAQVVIFLFRFHALYAEKKKMFDDYFAEDTQKFLFWTKKSLFFIVLMGVLSFSTLLFGVVYNYLFQLYAISVNFYIAISFINYAQLYGRLIKAEVTEQDRIEATVVEQKNAGIENYESLFGEHVAQWLAEKKYLVTQLTIEDMASEMGTNKLYMSRYINRKYGVNFSAWITDLRLEEAKTYMMEHPNVKQEEVAFHSGFSSSSYFSKVFSRAEGKTPVAWRKEMLTA